MGMGATSGDLPDGVYVLSNKIERVQKSGEDYFPDCGRRSYHSLVCAIEQIPGVKSCKVINPEKNMSQLLRYNVGGCEIRVESKILESSSLRIFGEDSSSRQKILGEINRIYLLGIMS